MLSFHFLSITIPIHRHYDESNLDSSFTSMRIYDGAPENAAPPTTTSSTGVSSSGAERPASEAASHASRDGASGYQRVISTEMRL